MIDQVDIKKMHHRNGSDTEIAAAHKVARTVAGRRLETLQGLAALGGVAAGEQIALETKLSILSIRPRISELLEMELLEDTFKRHTNTYGNTEIIWKLTKKGEKYVY